MDGQVRVMFQVPGRALIGTGPGPYGAVMAMLSDITVVEVGSRISTAYCGKLLRDLGATVIKLEPLAGDALRSTEPGYAAFLHGGKRSVAAAAGQAAVAALDRLSGSADVIICDDDDRDRLDRVLSLRDQHPDLVVATISDYGLSGPAAGRPATDFTLQAEAGISLLHPTGDRPPVAAGVELSELSGGVAAAVGVLTALLHAEAGGRVSRAGGPVPDADVSRFESLVALLQYPWLFSQIDGHSPYPLPQNAVPGLEPAKDGWVSAVAATPAQWTDFKKMAGIEQLDDARYAKLVDRIRLAAEATPLIREFTTRHTVAELVEMGARFRVPITPVGTPRSLPGLTPYASRGAYLADGAGVVQPRPPFRYDFAWRPARLAGIGEHDNDELSRPQRRPERAAAADPRKLLAGLRVLEFGTFQAGPLVGVNLAALGADVIKVEAVQRPDIIRFSSNMGVNRFWERAAAFFGPNLGKRGITADFTQPEGLEIIHRLIERSDVVLDNFLPRVLEGRGLDYEGVSRLRPDVIMVRMPAWGLTGPWRDRPGFTYSVNATSGLSELTGYPDGEPLLTGTIVDPLAALFTTFVTLAAIRRRQRTGQGGLIEVPLCDVAAQLTPRAVIAASVTGTEPTRVGNRSATIAPQGIYLGADGRWLAVSVAADQQWAAFAALPQVAEWAADDRFRELKGRLRHQAELDERLTAWSAGHNAADLASQLRQAGIPAATLETGADFTEHPQLLARGRVFTVEHESIGLVKCLGLPVRYAAGPAAWAPSAAPLFGQHNREVLAELGYGEDAINAMIESQVIGDAPAGLTFDRGSTGG